VEISSTIKRNSEFAIEARKVSKDASVEAEHGGAVAHNAVKAMEEINESSQKIASITGVIDEIAFQTNLLALNAAVEAARAGEHGKGFAVVASEVRNLSARSATAAKEIKALIEESVEKVKGGAQYVGESGNALDKIVASVKSLNGIMSDIANASHEQALGVDRINESMVSMNTITRDNTHIAKEVALAGSTIAEETVSLSNSLSFFRLKAGPSLRDKTAHYGAALDKSGHAKSANDEILNARDYDKVVSGL
jgi:methyl-accepting chemotaxis protein